MAQLLFSDRTTDGTSDSMTLTESRGAVSVTGTFDGATAAIQMSIDDGTTWVETDSVTSASMNVFQFIKRGKIRAVISSAGASTSLTVAVQQER